jgi:hypothetical protein
MQIPEQIFRSPGQAITPEVQEISAPIAHFKKG